MEISGYPWKPQNIYAYIQLFYKVFYPKIIIDSFSFLFSIMNLKILLYFFSAVTEIIFSNRYRGGIMNACRLDTECSVTVTHDCVE